MEALRQNHQQSYNFIMIDDQWDEFDSQLNLPEEPRWTLRKAIYLAIILLTLIAFIVYTLWPLFYPPAQPIPFPSNHQQV